MKNFDEKYYKIVKYVVLGFALCYTSFMILSFIFEVVLDIPHSVYTIKVGLGKLFTILAPFIVGLVFAYLFDPVVDFLQTKYDNFSEKRDKPKKVDKKENEKVKEKNRFAGTLLLYLIMFLVIGILILTVIKSINFSNDSDMPLSVYLINAISSAALALTNMNDTIQQKLVEFGVSSYLSSAVEAVFNFVKGLSGSVVNIIAGLTSGIFTGFLGLVMGFYILKDKAVFKRNSLLFLEAFIPDKANKKFLSFLSTLHMVFSGYIRGQLMDACIYGTLVAVTLSIIGMPYAVFIGMVSGFCNLIPYVGAIVAFGLSITIGLFSGNPMLALYSAVDIFVLQQIDSIYINPKCVSSKIDISPFLVIFSLAVGGSLFGIVGMLFAVPVTSALNLFISNFVKRQLESKKIKTMLTKKEE